MECQLCELKVKIHTYEETPLWTIIDCMSCFLPMAVWKEHTMDTEGTEGMELALNNIAKSKFNKYYIDKVQNQIPNHLHWHARPKGWIPIHLRNENPTIEQEEELKVWLQK